MSEASIQAKGREFLSTHSEKHAAILGFVVAFALGMNGLIAIVVVSLAAGSVEKIRNKKAIRQLRKEPWYGIGAGFLGYVVKTLGIIQAIGGLI